MNHNIRLPRNLTEKYLKLPTIQGLCLPARLLERAQDLGEYIDMQLEVTHKLETGSRLAIQSGRSMVFSCYQFISQLVALECWSLYETVCKEQHAIIIDNLTGLLAPGKELQTYARDIKNNLLPLPEHHLLAMKVYHLASALLHSYPHLAPPVLELSFPYKDLNGCWHELGPWGISDLVGEMKQWLADIGPADIAPA